MKYTNEIKAKVFAQYLGRLLNNGTHLTGNKIEWIYQGTDGHKDVLLVLKPLSAITKEDAIEVCKILYPEYGNVEYNWTERIGRFYIQNVFSDRTRGAMKAEIFQLLQSLGYDLPNWYLGGKTLHEANLAIYETV